MNYRLNRLRGQFSKKKLKRQRDTRFYPLFVQKWCFSCLERYFSKYFLQVPFFLVLTSRTRFRFTDFQFFHKHKKWRRPLLYQLFIKAVHISTMWTQTKWSLALWLTNDEASYVAKEDGICLLSVAKEATFNEQWIKPSVPLIFFLC